MRRLKSPKNADVETLSLKPDARRVFAFAQRRFVTAAASRNPGAIARLARIIAGSRMWGYFLTKNPQLARR